MTYKSQSVRHNFSTCMYYAFKGRASSCRDFDVLKKKRERACMDDTRLHTLLHSLLVWSCYWKFATDVVISLQEFPALFVKHVTGIVHQSCRD